MRRMGARIVATIFLGTEGFNVSVDNRNGVVSYLKACPPTGLDGGNA